MKNATTKEYEEAPSGAITLYNYKEPFMEFKEPSTGEGYGYEGVLMLDADGDTLQCHMCGTWHNSLAHHLRKEHAMSARHYKEMVGLNQSSALISENYRARLIAAKLKNGTLGRNIRPGKPKTEEEKAKIAATLRNRTRQTQNVFGTCPLQLKYRLQEMVERLGYLPRKKECVFQDSAERVYGSWKNFVEECGYEYRIPGKTIRHRGYTPKITTDELRAIYFNAVVKTGEKPTWQFAQKHYGWDRAKWRQVQLALNNRFTKPEKKDIEAEAKQAAKDLDVKSRLAILKGFYTSYQRMPSSSDHRRRLVPNLSWYYHHYGTIQNAVTAAMSL